MSALPQRKKDFAETHNQIRLVTAAQDESDEPTRKIAPEQPVAITGGCGFIGTNLAHRLASSGRSVLIIDNLSRPGAEANLRWLQETHGDRVQVEIADVRDSFALRTLGRAGQVFHLATQMTPFAHPVRDFEVNVQGTLNVLEALRALSDPPSLLFASTSQVYGNLPDVTMVEKETRREPADTRLLAHGLDESRPLNFHNPAVCAIGAAEQYVLNYARSFGLPAVVFRLSCIYGPHGDPSWVTHFLRRALRNEAVVVSGDGKQVRDVLFVEDLVEAMLLAQERMGDLSGQAFNIGGGPGNTVSPLELLQWIEALEGGRPEVRFHAHRQEDQPYYVSDTRQFCAATGWTASINAPEGVARLYRRLKESQESNEALIPLIKAIP